MNNIIILDKDIYIVLNIYENKKTKLYKCFKKNQITHVIYYKNKHYDIDKIYLQNDILDINYSYYSFEDKSVYNTFEHYFKPNIIKKEEAYFTIEIFENIIVKNKIQKKNLCLIWEDFM